MYSKLSSLITSMMGHTTDLRSRLISSSSGSSHPCVASQCASRNVSTRPVAVRAPSRRARIRPERSFRRSTFMDVGSEDTYSSSGAPKCATQRTHSHRLCSVSSIGSRMRLKTAKSTRICQVDEPRTRKLDFVNCTNRFGEMLIRL